MPRSEYSPGVFAPPLTDQRLATWPYRAGELAVVLRFTQEIRADAAAAKLKALVANRASVVRDGHDVMLSFEDLVVGDIVNDASLSFARSNQYAFTGVISGTGSVSQDGTGETVLSAAQTYLGDTLVRAGTLTLTTGTLADVSGVTVDNGATYDVRVTDTIRLLQGAGSVVLSSGVILSAVGFPTEMFTVLFALARTVGWVAQWNEMISDPEQKIGRPRQLYTGPTQRDYIPVSKR